MSRHASYYEPTFGVGRSVGRWLAHHKITYRALFRTLWAFNVQPKLNELGNPVLPETEMEGPSLVQPRKFSYHLIPRNASVLGVIAEEAAKAEEELIPWA